MSESVLPLEGIAQRIIVLRGQKVLLDTDLAALYGVTTKRFNEQIRRNAVRFPTDFMYQLEAEEWNSLRSQFATLKNGRGGHRKYVPSAFTEHGAIMAASVLSSPRAVEVSVYVVRAFVSLREAAVGYRELARRLDALENKTEALIVRHDVFARQTRNQFKQVFDALRELMTPPVPPRRPIGFVTPQETKPSTGNAVRKRSV